MQELNFTTLASLYSSIGDFQPFGIQTSIGLLDSQDLAVLNHYRSASGSADLELNGFEFLPQTTSDGSFFLFRAALEAGYEFGFNQAEIFWQDALTGLDNAGAFTDLAETQWLNLSFDELTQMGVDQAFSTPTYQLVGGTLSADTFTVLPNLQYNIFSGNGNVDFGRGGRDTIDLSGVLSTSVSLNAATARGGGVIFNPGNGARVFDSLTLSNGSQILFEGIDQIRFADGTLNLAIIPNDPLFGEQWNLHMMGVHTAWRFGTGSDRVMVGVEDTGLGVDARGNIHPDLRLDTTLVISDNYADDFFRNVPDSSYGPQRSSHGTAVHGIIAAASNNGLGMSGINWNAMVANIDVLDNNLGDQSLAEATQNLINYANSQGKRLVVNMSLGGGGIDPQFEQLVARNQSNALFVIAAGNNGRFGLSDPASLANTYANVIAVGASWGTEDSGGMPKAPGTRINYSNYGHGLTLMGPSEVVSLKAAKDTPAGVRFNFYDYADDFTGRLDLKDMFNGTSAAAPNVAGVASLVWSANPLLTATQVQTILSQTAYDLGAQGRDLIYGNGFVNADAAVRRALATAAGAA